MKDLHSDVGCSAWLIGFLIASFAAEWIFLQLLFATLPRDKWPQAAIVIIVIIIIGSWVAVYQRIQRRGG
ncbi:MAG: hypothetical protein U9Q70_05905 [Chloroflexota bacterium]|nr:hypothetical protein [Chloroflexota bacterium]